MGRIVHEVDHGPGSLPMSRFGTPNRSGTMAARPSRYTQLHDDPDLDVDLTMDLTVDGCFDQLPSDEQTEALLTARRSSE